MKGMFTVGLIVNKSILKTSSNGKNFLVLIVSDLVRYDLLEVEKRLAL